jgi:hypothetical protein
MLPLSDGLLGFRGWQWLFILEGENLPWMVRSCDCCSCLHHLMQDYHLQVLVPMFTSAPDLMNTNGSNSLNRSCASCLCSDKSHFKPMPVHHRSQFFWLPEAYCALQLIGSCQAEPAYRLPLQIPCSVPRIMSDI